MDEQLKEYRNWLIAAEQKAQEDFDKTVLSLSGGALGISFAFVKDIVGDQPLIKTKFLLTAWIAWGNQCDLCSCFFLLQPVGHQKGY